MATIQDIKNEWAQKCGASDFQKRMEMAQPSETTIDWIARRYAKAKLEEAKERARIEHHYYGTATVQEDAEMLLDGIPYSVNKDSIINTPLD